MNKKALLQNALKAVNHQQVEARYQLKQAEVLHMPELVRYWTEQIEELKGTHKGLLDWMSTLSGSQP